MTKNYPICPKCKGINKVCYVGQEIVDDNHIKLIYECACGAVGADLFKVEYLNTELMEG